MRDLVERIDALLPQTQCRQCQFDGCRPYAQAMSRGEVPINRCPPGGVETLIALATLLKQDPSPYLADMDIQAQAPSVAKIRADECIGCTKCLQVCPTDAIIGSHKSMHAILTDACTGCGLCLPPCPVDCIDLLARDETHPATWRERHQRRLKRLNKPKEKVASPAQLSQDQRQTEIQAALLRKRVRAIFSRLAEKNPEPRTELHYQTPFELLIAVMLSAQATDKSVNQATAILFNQANTPAGLLALGEKKLKEAIKTIGLYNSKAKHIIQSCEILIKHYNGEVPDDREALEALPGVGRKTANVVLNTAFGEATIAVDTHIFRVARRLGLSHGKTPLKVEHDLMECIPEPYRRHAHHWLILHGRYICQARKPRCSECPIRQYCDFPDKFNS